MTNTYRIRPAVPTDKTDRSDTWSPVGPASSRAGSLGKSSKSDSWTRFDVFGPTFRADPHPVYARHSSACTAAVRPRPAIADTGWWYLFRLRRRGRRAGRIRASAAPSPLPSTGCLRLCHRRSATVLGYAYAHWTLASSRRSTRQRTLLNRAFTARVVDALQPGIAARAADLLDGFRPAAISTSSPTMPFR